MKMNKMKVMIIWKNNNMWNKCEIMKIIMCK